MDSQYNLTDSDVSRFWGLVDTTVEHWRFTGSLDEDGYGRFRFGSRTDGSRRTALAHRVSFFISFGWLPPVVRHKCDIPWCMRPKCLLGGTQQENIADMDRRGRRASKLTPTDVIEIRALLLAGETQLAIATRYGVARSQISHIYHNRNWSGT